MGGQDQKQITINIPGGEYTVEEALKLFKALKPLFAGNPGDWCPPNIPFPTMPSNPDCPNPTDKWSCLIDDGSGLPMTFTRTITPEEIRG